MKALSYNKITTQHFFNSPTVPYSVPYSARWLAQALLPRIGANHRANRPGELKGSGELKGPDTSCHSSHPINHHISHCHRSEAIPPCQADCNSPNPTSLAPTHNTNVYQNPVHPVILLYSSSKEASRSESSPSA